MICWGWGCLKRISSKMLACLIWSVFHIISGLCSNLLSLCDAAYLHDHHSLVKFPCHNQDKLPCSPQHALLTICRYEVSHVPYYHCIVLQDLHKDSAIVQRGKQRGGKGRSKQFPYMGIS